MSFLKAVRASEAYSLARVCFDIQISCDSEKGRCTVASTDQGTGKNTGPDFQNRRRILDNEITLNYRYVMDGVSAMTSAQISDSVS